MFTNKAKELFEDWYINNHEEYGSENMPSLNGVSYECRGFYRYSDSMKWGVIQDFADSLGYYIGIQIYDEKTCIYSIYNTIKNHRGVFKKRQEARGAAIKKLNELINK